jgi:hypothetical protein
MTEPKIENSVRQDVEEGGHSSSKSAEKNVPWLPDNKVSLMSLLFLFFVGFYGIFMVSISWILYWLFALFFSPRIVNAVLSVVSKKHKQ